MRLDPTFGLLGRSAMVEAARAVTICLTLMAFGGLFTLMPAGDITAAIGAMSKVPFGAWMIVCGISGVVALIAFFVLLNWQTRAPSGD